MKRTLVVKYIGISQIIVEWNDYQDERFCEVSVSKTNQPNPLDQVHLNFNLKFSRMFSNRFSFIIGCNFRNLLDYDSPILVWNLASMLFTVVTRLGCKIWHCKTSKNCQLRLQAGRDLHLHPSQG